VIQEKEVRNTINEISIQEIPINVESIEYQQFNELILKL